jgi:outer membrane protein TolC
MGRKRRIIIWAGCAALAIGTGTISGVAQQDSPLVDGGLSLGDALAVARQNNPLYLQTVNDGARADWAVREAWGQLVPSARASASLAYEGAGTQTFGSLVSEGSTDFRRSSYALSMNYELSAETVARIQGSNAGQDATYARIRAAEFLLESSVTRQYLAALRARDGVRVAERQLERARQNHEITSARVEAGVALPTDRKQTEVDLGRAEITILRAQSNLRAEKLRLAEQLGVDLGAEFELSSSFQVFDPEVSRDVLVESALESHPNLRALRASESARDADVWTARSQYFPSLNVFAQWAGFTRQAMNEDYLVATAESRANSAMGQCNLWNDVSRGLSSPLEGFPMDCSPYQWTPEAEAQVLAANDVWPWDFTRQPLYVQAQISIPVFQGFTRQRQVEEAHAAAEDAFEARRAEELRVRTSVNTAFDSLSTSFQVVEIEEGNLQVAQEQLELARQRYQLGAAPYLELLQAEESLATAERDYLNALYDFHDNLSSLEYAVGARLLRDVGTDGSMN